MHALYGIGITVLLWIASEIIQAATGVSVTPYMILVSAVWAAIDSAKIELRKYPSGLSYHPVVLFIAVAALWIIGLPWYLAVRYKIKKGLLNKKVDIPSPENIEN
jgi:membrane protein YdbS with pleckstrin-like domain